MQMGLEAIIGVVTSELGVHTTPKTRIHPSHSPLESAGTLLPRKHPRYSSA